MHIGGAIATVVRPVLLRNLIDDEEICLLQVGSDTLSDLEINALHWDECRSSVVNDGAVSIVVKNVTR